MRYICILGRNPELSILELAAYLRRKHCAFAIKKQTEQYVLLDAEHFPQTAITELGGTLIVAKETDLKQLIFARNKIFYAVIDSGGGEPAFKEHFKEICAEQRVRATQKYGGRTIPSPSSMTKLDYVFVLYKNLVFLAEQISNPKEYAERDETRSVFDPLAVTSIRLAKILINLAEAQKEILDPFCGTGTILQEALLMGYSVIGVDKNIVDAQNNLKTIQRKQTQTVTLHKGKAQQLGKFVKSAEAAVTEPYMGPYLKKLPTDEEAAQIIAELTELYRAVFEELAKVVNGKIVIVIPRLRTFMKKYEIPMDELLKKSGLRIVSPVQNIKLPLLYQKKKSKVERFIYVLEKV